MHGTWQRVRGTRDFLPEDTCLRDYVANKIISAIEKFGYRRIETPSIEYFSLFEKKSGEQLKEEIYYFKDKGGREVCLIPEVTPPVARVVSQRKDLKLPIRYYYFTKVWRYDEPQRGRYREFYQIGIELIGLSSVYSDTEVLWTAIEGLKALDIKPLIELNDRRIIDKILSEIDHITKLKVMRLIDKRRKISEKEFEENLFNLLENYPDKLSQVKEFTNIYCDLNKAIEKLQSLEIDTSYIESLCECVEAIDIGDYIKFSGDIVRGLDYYTGMIFEIFIEDRNLACGGGGRYDNLVGIYANRNIPAVGFAYGFDRIVDYIETKIDKKQFFKKVDYYIYVLDKSLYKKAVDIAKEIIANDYSVVIDVKEKSLRSALEYASGFCKYFIIIGKKEIEQNKIKIKNLENYEEKELNIRNFLSNFK